MSKRRKTQSTNLQKAYAELSAAIQASDAGYEGTLKLMEIFDKYPELRQNQVFQKIVEKYNQLQPVTNSGVQLLADLNDYVTSSGEIKIADAERRKLVAPTMPSTPSTRALQSRVGEARLRESTAGADEQAIINRITDDQYAQDLANARVASTGQASAYGSYAQAASNRRARNRIAGRQQVRQAVAGQEARVDALTKEQMDQEQRNFYNRMMVARILEYRYARDQQYVNELGQTARQSRRNALQNMAGPLSDVLSMGAAQLQMRGLGRGDVETTTAVEGMGGGFGMGIIPMLPTYSPNMFESAESPEALTDAYAESAGVGGGNYTPTETERQALWEQVKPTAAQSQALWNAVNTPGQRYDTYLPTNNMVPMRVDRRPTEYDGGFGAPFDAYDKRDVNYIPYDPTQGQMSDYDYYNQQRRRLEQEGQLAPRR